MRKKDERTIGDNSFPMAAKLIEAKELIYKSISKIEGVRNRAWSNKFIYNEACFDKNEKATDYGLDAVNLINDIIREELNQEPHVHEGSLCEVEDEK